MIAAQSCRSLQLFLWAVLLMQAVSAIADDNLKVAIPDEEAQKTALSNIAQFKEDYLKANTSAEKVALANKMILQASVRNIETTTRFVLLKVARDIATKAGDVRTAMEAIDDLGLHFRVATVSMKAEAIGSIAQSQNATISQKAALGDIAAGLIDAAVDKDDYESAERFVAAAIQSARVARKNDALKSIIARKKQIEGLRTAYKEVIPALDILKEDATNAKANQMVGKFLCFNKGDWKRGTGMLALGYDPVLQLLAKKEMTGTESVEGSLAIADDWWAASEKAKGIERENIQDHAAKLYEHIVSKLSDHDAKQRAKERLSLVAGSMSHGVVRGANRTGKKSVKPTDFLFVNESEIKTMWKLPDKWQVVNGGLGVLVQREMETSIVGLGSLRC